MAELVVRAVAMQELLKMLKNYEKRAPSCSGTSSKLEERHFLVWDPLGCSGQDKMLGLCVKSSHELTLLMKFWL
jgi:hypothetical protein